MIENAELVMQMLEMYQMYKQQVPVELEEYLRYVAKTGNTLFQWTLVKPFIREKILNVIAEFAEQSSIADIPLYPNVDPFNYEAMKTVLLERFDTFNGPPFTIQRLCELLSCPRKEYSRVDKFMRAVEKNILVVSTCELRAKREETIVNGVPDRWENGKDSDINMDLVDKNNVISDVKGLNDNDNTTVESFLDELESMKTPIITKLDEIKNDHKDQQEQDHLAAQVIEELEPDIPVEEPKHDIEVIITDTPQIHITNTTEVVEQINTNVIEVINESVVDPPKEHNTEGIDEIQPVEVNEPIVEKPIEELNILSNINLENVEITEEPSIAETNKLDQEPELIPTTDSDRVEGSIIHQTPDSDNKVELDIATSQPEIELEKSNKDVERMDVQVEDETKSMESEVNCDNVQEKCTESTISENEKLQDDVDKSAVDIPPPDVPSVELISTEMDVELEKIKNDTTTQETVSVNEEETKITEPDTVLEESQEQDENKMTESK